MDIILIPYKGYLINNINYEFGAGFHDKKKEEVIKLEIDNTIGEFSETYTGRRLHVFRNEVLSYVKFVWDQSVYNLIIEGESISDSFGMMKLRSKYEIIESGDKSKILIPEMGIYIEEDSERKGNNRTIILFSKALFSYFAKKIKVIYINPYVGYSNICNTINFSMTPGEIVKIDGNSKRTVIDFKIMKNILEFREESIQLTFSTDNEKGRPLFQNLLARQKDGVKVVVDNLNIFEENDHALLKERFEYIDSLDKKSTFFPGLGIETCGCGEKKNKGEGKYILAFPRNFLNYYKNAFEVINLKKKKK